MEEYVERFNSATGNHLDKGKVNSGSTLRSAKTPLRNGDNGE